MTTDNQGGRCLERFGNMNFKQTLLKVCPGKKSYYSCIRGAIICSQIKMLQNCEKMNSFITLTPCTHFYPNCFIYKCIVYQYKYDVDYYFHIQINEIKFGSGRRVFYFYFWNILDKTSSHFTHFQSCRYPVFNISPVNPIFSFLKERQ